MDQAIHNRIVSFLWGIADDVLRDLFKRGKYPDVILPMCVLRRLDAVLEPTKAKVLEAKRKLDAAEIKEQHAALRAAADAEGKIGRRPFHVYTMKQAKELVERFLRGQPGERRFRSCSPGPRVVAPSG